LNKNRIIISALIILSIITTLLLFGCASRSDVTATPARKCQVVMVKDVVDANNLEWKIYQLRLELEGGATFTIDLNLRSGDRVDCWYKIEKPKTGGSVDFQIKAGTSTIYSSVSGANEDGNNSDRLTFNAVQSSGTSYRLIFYNGSTDENSKETIYTEIIYPANTSDEDSIFIPLIAE